MAFVPRTKTCGELRAAHTGEIVTLNGWAHRVRDLGGVMFVDLRDRTGLVQLYFDPNSFPVRPDFRHEACLSVTGKVRERAEETKNSKMATGDIEVEITGYTELSPAKPLPFPVSDEEHMQQVNEELRIKHRYLDLRRPSMFNRLALRADLIRRIHLYLDAQGFLEVETPIITKSTPEGARDYLVPYRLEAGLWYALPQSPQQYKQLLMVAGIERYYQIAKCFRDESQRADRQPEFTQLDMELSFTTQEEILTLTEGLLREAITGVISKFGLEKDPIEPFTRLTYDDALLRYGSDKPDLRFGLEIWDATDLFRTSEFAVFANAIEAGGFVRGIRYPGGASLSRKQVSELEELAKDAGAKGLGTVMFTAEGIKGSIAKFVDAAAADQLRELSGAVEGDLLLFVADAFSVSNNVLNRLRLEIGDRLKLRDPRKLAFCWVVDFPLVEWDAENQHWTPSHHPFTAPKEADMPYINSDPGRMRADCYDAVCNGTEIASGSIRIHQPEMQSRIFDLLGIDAATQQERFGHILEAFSYGPPPHGGIAPG
ncbi:MAG: aspartate--tRNA ligase, partial [Fimbriimonas sp.]